MNDLADTARAGARVGSTWGIAVVILGLLAMMAPLVSGLAVTMLVAVIMMAAGLAQTVYAFKSESAWSGVGRFLFGGLAVLCGLLMLARPGAGLATITMFLAAYFFVDGVFSLYSGLKFRPFEGWGTMVFSGVVSILLAVMIWAKWPVSGVWAVGILVGVRLLFAGWTMVMLGAVGEGIVDELEAEAESLAQDAEPAPSPVSEPPSVPEADDASPAETSADDSERPAG